MEFETPTVEQKESIKLIKNTKGYNWEIKIHFPNETNPENQIESDKIAIARLQLLDLELKSRFPNEVKDGC